MLPQILLFGLLGLIVACIVALPLLRGRGAAAGRAAYDRAVYRDQLAEVERDIARGLINETEAASARLEIQRRLLAAGGEEATGPAIAPPRGRWLAVALALFMLVGAGGVYAWLGSPGTPDLPFAARQVPGDSGSAEAAGAGHVNMREAATQLRARLDANPADGAGWALYGRTMAEMSQWDAAADAFRRALANGESGPDLQASYGETLTLAAQGIVTPAAHDAFVAALKDSPKHEVARYYLAIAAGQAGEAQTAIDLFVKLLADLPSNSAMREEIIHRVTEASQQAALPLPAIPPGQAPTVPAADAPSGPDAAAMEAVAGLSDDERKKMVDSMVEKLAAKLQANPNDADGWLQLGRAYVVQGKRDQAADAYDHAATLKPEDVQIRLREVDALIGDLKPSDAIPPRAVSVLQDVRKREPDEPNVLWYLGVVAARTGHLDEARENWNKLLAKLPPGEDANMVKAALDQIKG